MHYLQSHKKNPHESDTFTLRDKNTVNYQK